LSFLILRRILKTLAMLFLSRMKILQTSQCPTVLRVGALTPG
jgi:hypothetical protein